jgi:hypothetical protein
MERPEIGTSYYYDNCTGTVFHFELKPAVFQINPLTYQRKATIPDAQMRGGPLPARTSNRMDLHRVIDPSRPAAARRA